MIKKICIFTSTRADYGILSPLIKKLSTDPAFEVRLFVTGTHLLSEHGNTVNEILEDGVTPFYSVTLDMVDNAGTHHLENMGVAILKFSSVLVDSDLDAAIVLGDRFETLSFSIVANGLGIPLIHLHGGEVTEGALDDGYRHCITKLSNLHFTASEKSRKRVLSMGESPDRVFNVGALGVDNALSVRKLSKEELSKDLNIAFREKVIIFTYHPETSSPGKDLKQLSSLLAAVKKRIELGDVTVIFTRSNADHGGCEVHRQIERFVRMNGENCYYFMSLGASRYLSALAIADVVVGNSSSGIIEAPAVGTPTVNIGDRQKGREMAKSIFNVQCDECDILSALNAALTFKLANKGKNFSLFGDGTAATKIVQILKAQKFQLYPIKSFFECSDVGSVL